MSVYGLTVETEMHAMQPARTFDEVSPCGQRGGISMWSRLHEGRRVLIFEDRMSSFTLCVVYADRLLELTDEQIGQFIVELIGLQYSDDTPADYVRRAEQLREALSRLERHDQILFMHFHLQFRRAPHPPIVKYMDPE